MNSFNKPLIHFMKNYKLWNEGDRVRITRTHGEDLDKEGVITEVRCSFCKILLDGETKTVNHTYGQFVKA